MNRPDDERREREFAALDRLLEAQPEPRPPAGLAQRVLAATAAERAAGAPRRVGRPWTPAGPGRAWRVAGLTGLAAAAALLLWFARPRAGADRPGPDPLGDGATRVASAAPEAGPGTGAELEPEAPPAPAGLLAELELLEEWELLVPEDLDLLLAELDELDELLLELPAAGEAAVDAGEEG